MEGVNFVELRGVMRQPQVKETKNGYFNFQGKIAIPRTYTDKATGEVKETHNYVKISAWGDLAQDLAGIPENTWVTVQGAFNERSYNGSCKSCNNQEKKYWTDVLVDNFVVHNEEGAQRG